MSFLGSIFGGGGGGGGGPTLPQRFVTRTNAFNVDSQFDPATGTVNTSLFPTGNSPGQRAFGERFPRILGDIDTLRGTITPGFSDLRQARLNEIGNARSQAISNLRGNLARRRVLGSSFGEDAIIRAEREFADARAASQAQSFLEELAANRDILTLEAGQVQEALNNDFRELGIAVDVGQQAAQVVSANTQFQLQQMAAEAAGRGELSGSIFGQLLGFAGTIGGAFLGGPAGAAIGGSLFGGGGGGGLSAGSSKLFGNGAFAF